MGAVLAVLGNFEAYDRVRDMVAGTFIERAGSNMDLESGMTVTIGAAGVKLDMRGTHANIARHVRRTASALDRDSPVHPPISQKGAYRDLDDAKEKDWNRGHKLDPPEGDYTAGQKDKKRGATASTKGKASFRGAVFKKARFTTGVTVVEEN